MRGLLILLVFVTSSLYAQDGAKKSNLKKGLALQGYDAVGYFKKEVKKGLLSLRSQHKGIEYLFATAQNKALFDANPNQYLPQYGGWCAYAMGKDGSKVKINPHTYKIVDNKLYLFYNQGGYNTLHDWNKQEAALKKAADAFWKKIIEE